MPRQLEFKKVKGWGGKRKGAGRPNRSGEVSHRKREKIDLTKPVHITLHLEKKTANLRNSEILVEFRKAIIAAKPFGLSVLHYSLQKNHLHMIVEAPKTDALGRGMKSFGSRFAKAIRKIIGGNGRIFAGRFHAHVLKTPTEMRRALAYVLLNYSKHTKLIEHIDDYSSGYAFQHWRELIGHRVKGVMADQLRGRYRSEWPELSPPQSWMARIGWQRGKSISFA